MLVTLSKLDCTMKLVPPAKPSGNPLFLLEYLWFQAKMPEIELLKRWRRAAMRIKDRNPVGYWRLCLKDLLATGKLWTHLRSRVRALGTDLQKDSGCPALKTNLGVSRRDVRAPMGWRWAWLLVGIHSLHKQIHWAWPSATVWWKWHIIKEPEDLAGSQETASGQKMFT